MKTMGFMMMLGVMGLMAGTSFAEDRQVVTAGTPAGQASTAKPQDAKKPSAVGGGIKHPWARPYTIALAVPEPTSLALLGAGAMSLIMRRRRG
jgi:hypothetical protein